MESLREAFQYELYIGGFPKNEKLSVKVSENEGYHIWIRGDKEPMPG